jgi:hypothetical protein
MKLRSQRGSGLLLAIIVVLVITLVAVGVIRFSARELSGAYAGRRQDALVACAEAGRQLLQSRFRALGAAPTQIAALNVTLDSSSGRSTQVLAGHYDGTVQVEQVVALPDGSMGPNPFSMQDRSNAIRGTGGSGFGGTPYKVVVHCQDGTDAFSRQLEVEYTVRFGL